MNESYKEEKVRLSDSDVEKLTLEFKKVERATLYGIPFLLVVLCIAIFMLKTPFSVLTGIVTSILLLFIIWYYYSSKRKFNKNIADGYKLVITGHLSKMKIVKGLNCPTSESSPDFDFVIDRKNKKLTIRNKNGKYERTSDFANETNKEFYYFLTIGSREIEVEKSIFTLFDLGDKINLELTSTEDFRKISKVM